MSRDGFSDPFGTDYNNRTPAMPSPPVLASGNLMEPLTKALDLYKELRWSRYEAWEGNGRSHWLQS